jgi:hypothetical protein
LGNPDPKAQQEGDNISGYEEQDLLADFIEETPLSEIETRAFFKFFSLFMERAIK